MAVHISFADNRISFSSQIILAAAGLSFNLLVPKPAAVEKHKESPSGGEATTAGNTKKTKIVGTSRSLSSSLLPSSLFHLHVLSLSLFLNNSSLALTYPLSPSSSVLTSY